MSKNSFLENIEVKNPCSESWEEMRGTDKARFCSHCAFEVNNLSAMTRKQALKLVRQSNGRICVRYVKNPQTNQPVFREKLYQISRRAGIAAGVLGASLSLSATNYAQNNEPQIPEIIGTVGAVKRVIGADENKAEDTTASISGTITDPNGAVIPNVSVTLTNAETQEKRSAISNDRGFYEFAAIAAGNYSLKTEAAGFTDTKLEKIIVAESEKAKADMQMNVSSQYITMGVVALASYQQPLHLAVSNDEIGEVKNLIVRGARVNAKEENFNNITPLFVAVERGNTETAEMLLNFGAKVNARDDEKQTPLMRLDEDASIELVELLIKHGAKINAADSEGNTALILTANYVKAEVLQILLKNGADVNAQNKEGETALMTAAEEGNIENARALIMAGAEINLKNIEGETAWGLTSDEEIEKLLEAHGAKTDDN